MLAQAEETRGQFTVSFPETVTELEQSGRRRSGVLHGIRVRVMERLGFRPQAGGPTGRAKLSSHQPGPP